MRAKLERMRDEFFSPGIGRICNDACKAGGRAHFLEEVDAAADMNSIPVEQVRSVHIVTMGAQDAGDGALSGGRLPNPMRQCLHAQQCEHRLRRSRLKTDSAFSEGMTAGLGAGSSRQAWASGVAVSAKTSALSRLVLQN